MSNPEISIVICAHDEEPSLRILLPKIAEVMNGAGRAYEVVLVNDGSSDGTGDVVRQIGAEHPQFRVLDMPQRGGQTGCFRAAFGEIRGEWVIRMDADLQDDPADLPKFIARFDEGSDLVMGLRECRKHGRMLRIAGALYDLLILALFDTPLHSNTGSFVGFRTRLVRGIPFRPNDHRYIPLVAIWRGAERIAEVIVRHHPRQFGVSHYKALRKLLLGIPEVLFFLLRLYRGVYDLPASNHAQSTQTIIEPK